MADNYKTKFEKLITEYGKLLTHLKVLKRGYLDSRSNATELTEQLKLKEKALRRNEIEIQSLNFRNQQLTKRICVLQNDLDVNEKKGLKKMNVTGKQVNKQFDDAVIQEELQKRITENSKLACQLEDNTLELQQLKEKLANIEKSHYEKDMQYKCDISRLKHQNQKLSVMLNSNHEDKPKSCSISDSHSEDGVDFEIFAGEIFSTDLCPSSEEQQLQKSLKKLEQENQILKMEYEVMKMENESLRIARKDYTEKSSTRQRCDSTEDDLWPKPVWHGEQSFYSSDIGKLTVPFCIDEEVLQREQNIIKYFNKVINKLVTEKQNCESLINLYAAEYEALSLRSNWLEIESNSLAMQN